MRKVYCGGFRQYDGERMRKVYYGGRIQYDGDRTRKVYSTVEDVYNMVEKD